MWPVTLVLAAVGDRNDSNGVDSVGRTKHSTVNIKNKRGGHIKVENVILTTYRSVLSIFKSFFYYYFFLLFLVLGANTRSWSIGLSRYQPTASPSPSPPQNKRLPSILHFLLLTFWIFSFIFFLFTTLHVSTWIYELSGYFLYLSFYGGEHECRNCFTKNRITHPTCDLQLSFTHSRKIPLI